MNFLLLVIGLAMYENVFSLFAVGGIICEVTALWLTKEKNIRILSLVAAPCWLAYNLANFAYSSAFGNVLAMVSIIITMIRLDLRASRNTLKADQDESKTQEGSLYV